MGQADIAARDQLQAHRAAKAVEREEENEEMEENVEEVDEEEKQLQAAMLTDAQREGFQQRLDAWREERFEGLPGALPVQRGHVDFQDPSYSACVGQAVDEIVARTGCLGGP